MSSSRQRLSSGNDLSSDDFSIEEVVPLSGGQSGSASRHNDLRRELIARRATHQAELERLDEESRMIEELRKQQMLSIQGLTQQLNSLDKRNASGQTAIQNYFDRFEWSDRVKEQMRKVFGIENFRLAQEGVCNANMDGRDAICIMPTGGGKSLTYQLPATLMPGCTLVISPLVSLMKDQMLHLQENRIEGLMFTASMSNAEKVEAYDRLNATAMGNDPAREVKLCYVTPERIGKSKKFMSVVGTMVTAKKLARIVIDEAHCVSQLGHDYRPDYKQLASLRMLYPHVPILALSATCPPVVLRDLIATLRLPPLTDGRGAASHGTVLFTSPLYRKNLHYKVLPKPPGSARLMRDMVKYILEHHPNQSGIVYCLSRADSERVAADLDSVSQGRIKTGVYHAEINDKAKEELHESWRRGRVKVVCATIAFGLGIDKADVRFVLHHSMSKSVETFYQESGRAGRDGRDADCIMYYRLQDALRTPGILSDPDWQRQVHGMAKFCLDLQGCRKLEFAKYFSSFDSTWAEDNSRCGHCDNCTRDPASVVQSDVTLDAKRVLAVARILHSRKIKVTAAQLALTTRGAGPQSKLLQLAPGDKVTLSPLDTETLMAHMLLEGYLEKSYTPTAYRVQVYIKPGARARRLDEGQKVVTQFLLPERAMHDGRERLGGKKRKAGSRPRNSNSNSNGRVARGSNDEDEDVDADVDVDGDGDGDEDGDMDEDVGDYSGEEDREEEDEVGQGRQESVALGSSPAKRRRSNYGSGHGSSWSPVPFGGANAGREVEAEAEVVVVENDDVGSGSDDEEDVEWTGNLRGAPVVTHPALRRSPRKKKRSRPSRTNAPFVDKEVLEISSE